MSITSELRPDSLFGSELDPDEDEFYNTLNEQSGRKSSLSLPEFRDEENVGLKFKSFINKEPTILSDLRGSLFNFDKENNFFDQYYQKAMDINALWPLIRGNVIINLKIHNSREYFDRLPFRFDLKGVKYQLDKAIINSVKYESKPDLYYQSIPEYYKFIKNFCDQNCDVIPYKFSNDKIIFLPIISPLWFMNGKLFKSVENYGYINPNSEFSYGWLSNWLSNYNLNIKEKYTQVNKKFLEQKSFITDEKQQDEYKKKLVSSVMALIKQPKFINRFKEDSSFRKKHLKHYKDIINFSELLCKANLMDFDVLYNIVNNYTEIICYNIVY